MTLFGITFPERQKTRWKNNQMVAKAPLNTVLSLLSPGRSAQVTGFLDGLSAERRSHLQSYGLVPGAVVRVVQHNPVTIVQVEHLEIALEGSLAEKVQICS